MRKIGYCLLFLILSGIMCLLPAVSAKAGGIYTSPYVTFAPDQRAWTIDRPLEEGAGQGVYRFWYDSRDDFRTGITSALRGLKEGEHYYDYTRMGLVPVGEWRVAHSYASCIQGSGIWSGGSTYHGIRYGTSNCGKPYYSGWMAYCADCGRPLSTLIYMGKEAARSLSVLDVEMDYYYLCPNAGCRHLEQGRAIGAHYCKLISYNRYRVVYMGNGDAENKVRGDMAPSFHMYDNENVFEGNTVTPVRTLTMNSYTRKGFRFAGWNTEPDGAGVFYADGEEILNLTTENYDVVSPQSGTITLYAQWERVDSALAFDAGEGSYSGENPVIREYGSSYIIDESKGTITPPAGYTVSFYTGGGIHIPPVTSTRTFLRWDIQEPIHGDLEDNVYTFLGNMDDVDTMVAVYSLGSIILPTPEKENRSFGGWYLDEALTRPVGYGGEDYTPVGDITLYAGWVDLQLRSTENYTDNDGKGAVDLAWFQHDNVDKTYKLYQSADMGDSYFQISGMTESVSAEDGLDLLIRYENIGNADKQRTVTIPSSGFYILTANGAQGGSCGSHSGGKGGGVSGKFYLKKGEVITFQIGGQDGTNGGGEASDFGQGGGMTRISSNLKGVLLVAGGGGGATSSEDGQAGGSGSNTVESGHVGESGMAGGGGGYLGGMAGEHILHHHDEDCMESVSSQAQADFYAKTAQSSQNTYADALQNGGNYAKLSVHTKAEAGDDCWYQFRVGDRDTYFDVPGSGTLSMNVSYSDWGDSIHFRGVEITVMSMEGDTIAKYTTGYDLVTDALAENRVVCTANGNSYKACVYTKSFSDSYFNGSSFYRPSGRHKHVSGDYHYLNRTIDYSGTFTVDIPEDIGGVYIICKTKYFATTDVGVWAETQICDVRYSYSGYACDYDEGQVISSRPGYGGSNYINQTYAIAQTDLTGVWSGNGMAYIKGEIVGLSDDHEMKGVAAADMEAPYAVDADDILKEPLGEGAVLVHFGPVEDRGTEYYFKAESYSVRTGQLMCTSNITKNLLLTGLKGYLYLVDVDNETEVTISNAVNADNPLTDPVIEVFLAPYTQYLHIAAVDNAGNVSESAHVEIKWDDKIAWGISTDKVCISSVVGGRDYGNVYPAQSDDIYYVRADGAAPFLLSFASYLHGAAREDYQVNYQIFQASVGTELTQRHITRLPYTLPVSSTEALDAAEYIRQTQGPIILEDALYTGASRSNAAKNLEFYQAFTINTSFHGETITATPTAGALFEDSIYYSDAADDAAHAIHLIADGEPPVVTGLSAFQSLSLIDRNEGSVILEIKASDKLSGIKEFTLLIENKDNFCQAVYKPDRDGIIRVEITEDEPLFGGSFTVTGYAADNVGNEVREEWYVTEFALETKIQRILSPHEPVFKRGESGILYITTWGYADYVEVEFPDFLSEYDQRFVYTGYPEYKKEEQLRFMIPLYAPEGRDYRITVRAYKGDEQLEDHPSISAININGTILDELRTRLR